MKTDNKRIFKVLTVAMCIWHAFIGMGWKDKILFANFVLFVDKDFMILKNLGHKTIKTKVHIFIFSFFFFSFFLFMSSGGCRKLAELVLNSKTLRR